MTHDPAIFCRPPEGTPQGTTCWLYANLPGGKRQWIAAIWLGNDLWGSAHDFGANRVARAGWRFHSIAEVPHD